MKVFKNTGLSEDDVIGVSQGVSGGFEQQLIAEAGQVAKTVLVVAKTNVDGEMQGCSLDDGNVVKVYSTSDDYISDTPLYTEMMQKGEPITFSGLQDGSIVTSEKGFYGLCRILNRLMPLLSLGLAFTESFFYAYRNSAEGSGYVYIANGAIKSKVTIYDSAGAVVLSQQDVKFNPWELKRMDLDGNGEYRIKSTNKVMASHTSNGNSNYDGKVIMPLYSDVVGYPKNGYLSALYDNTSVVYYEANGDEGTFTVSPGSPYNVNTLASDNHYQSDHYIRYRASGPISGFAGGDGYGSDSTPFLPSYAFSQVNPQPFQIKDSGGANITSLSFFSMYEGEAKVYSWNTTTSSLDLEYTIPITRTGVTVSSREDQYHPSGAQLSNTTSSANVTTLIGDLNPGIVISDVPIGMIIQTNQVSPTFTLRTQNGGTDTHISTQGQETLMLGMFDEFKRSEIREDADEILRKRVISNTGTETWEVV